MKALIWACIAGVLAGIGGTYAVLTTGRPAPQGLVRDLGDVPKVSAEVAEEHRADGYHRIHTIEQMLALPGDFSQTEALYTLAGRADSAGVQDLIHEMNRVRDARDRRAGLGILFSRLAELDPLSGLALARTATFADEPDFEAQVWASWGKLDFDAALAAAARETDNNRRNFAAQALYRVNGYLANDQTARIESRLGIPPDRAIRSRYLFDIADRSPVDAVAYINNLSTYAEQVEATQWLANHYARGDSVNAAGHAELFRSAMLRQLYRDSVANAIAAQDPEKTLQQLAGNQSASRGHRQQVVIALQQLADRDVEAAMRYIDDNLVTPRESYLRGVVAAELARQDPDRAIDWAMQAPSAMERQQSLMQVIAAIAETDPQLALDASREIEQRQFRDQAVSTIVSTVAQRDPAAAAALLTQLDDRRLRQAAANNLVNIWFVQDPEAAIDWVFNNEQTHDQDLLARAGQMLAMNDVDAAIRLLPRLDKQSASTWRQSIAMQLARERSADAALSFVNRWKDSDDFPLLLATVAGDIAGEDPYRARQLVDELPAGATRDNAMSQVVIRHSATDPAEAASWLASIGDDGQRAMAASSVTRQWYNIDPDSAMRWAQNLPAGNTRDTAVLTLASHWEQITPLGQWLINSVSDPEQRTQALSMQLMRVAERDPERALTLLQSADLPASQRDAIAVAIKGNYH